MAVYKSTEDPYSPSLFVPFSDQTSGSEAFKSGRHFDLEESGGDGYMDFNCIYNPYYAYNSRYACPIPPKENKSPLEILAGEKNHS